MAISFSLNIRFDFTCYLSFALQVMAHLLQTEQGPDCLLQFVCSPVLIYVGCFPHRLLADTGPFEIPIRCVTKKAKMTLSTSVLDFGRCESHLLACHREVKGHACIVSGDLMSVQFYIHHKSVHAPQKYAGTLGYHCGGGLSAMLDEWHRLSSALVLLPMLDHLRYIRNAFLQACLLL